MKQKHCGEIPPGGARMFFFVCFGWTGPLPVEVFYISSTDSTLYWTSDICTIYFTYNFVRMCVFVCVVHSGSIHDSSLCTERRWMRRRWPSPAAAYESNLGSCCVWTKTRCHSDLSRLDHYGFHRDAMKAMKNFHLKQQKLWQSFAFFRPFDTALIARRYFVSYI